ncbi:diacylglycerol kinase (ATP) [Canna indica]|uniref:Diacylglycerol kinase (ATP) n=1 Tax=Canna indica TaxID=4628 RepID=A0AAQ3PZ35_9LILI|nr:diacylglycerol kinase (ATP) [Canna indica]
MEKACNLKLQAANRASDCLFLHSTLQLLVPAPNKPHLLPAPPLLPLHTPSLANDAVRKHRWEEEDSLSSKAPEFKPHSLHAVHSEASTRGEHRPWTSWHIIMRMQVLNGDSFDPILPPELPHAMHKFPHVSVTDSLNMTATICIEKPIHVNLSGRLSDISWAILELLQYWRFWVSRMASMGLFCLLPEAMGLVPHKYLAQRIQFKFCKGAAGHAYMRIDGEPLEAAFASRQRRGCGGNLPCRSSYCARKRQVHSE